MTRKRMAPIKRSGHSSKRFQRHRVVPTQLYIPGPAYFRRFFLHERTLFLSSFRSLPSQSKNGGAAPNGGQTPFANRDFRDYRCPCRSMSSLLEKWILSTARSTRVLTTRAMNNSLYPTRAMNSRYRSSFSLPEQ